MNVEKTYNYAPSAEAQYKPESDSISELQRHVSPMVLPIHFPQEAEPDSGWQKQVCPANGLLSVLQITSTNTNFGMYSSSILAFFSVHHAIALHGT